MKHREAYTGRGGQSMSQTNLGKAVRCLMAVLVVVYSYVLLACPGQEAQVRSLNSTPVACNSTNAAALAAAPGVTALSLTFASPSSANVFDSRFPTTISSVTVAFGTAATTGPSAPSVFALTSSNGSASGTVGAFSAVGAFTLTYTSSTYTSSGAGQGPRAGQTNAFTACNIRVTGGPAEVGGAPVTATVVVVLTSTRGTVTSQSFTTTIKIAADGTLIIRNPGGADVVTNVNVLATGVTGVS